LKYGESMQRAQPYRSGKRRDSTGSGQQLAEYHLEAHTNMVAQGLRHDEMKA